MWSVSYLTTNENYKVKRFLSKKKAVQFIKWLEKQKLEFIMLKYKNKSSYYTIPYAS